MSSLRESLLPALLLAAGCVSCSGDDDSTPGGTPRGGKAGMSGNSGQGGASGKAGGSQGKGGSAGAGQGGSAGAAGKGGAGGAGAASGSAGQGGAGGAQAGAGAAGGGAAGSAGGAVADPFVFHVSLQGNDAWSGHLAEPQGTDGPFRTVERAVKALNEKGQTGEAGGFSIRIRGGTYFLSEPLIVTASGAPGKPVVIENYQGERAVLSGGVEIVGWAASAGLPGRVQAPAGIAASELAETFQTLRVKPPGAGEGSWASLARWPKKASELTNPDWQNPGFWLYARGTPTGGDYDGTTNFLTVPLQLADHATIAPWDLSSAQIRFFPLTYTVYNLPVGQVLGSDANDPSLRIFTGPYGPTTYLPEGMRFALANLPQAIQQEGEWAIDRKGAQVYYQPPAGGMEGQSLVLSRLTRLLAIRGAEGAHAHDVAVRGLVFTDASTSAHDFFPSTTIDFAVEVSFADDVSLERNLFEYLGGSALCVRSASQRVTVQENVFAHIGQAAIEVLSSTEVLSTDASRAPGHVAILGNYVRDANHDGKLGAIYFFSGSDSLIEGNLIATAAGSGIQILGLPESRAERNQIFFNDVHTVNYGIADGGGIYLTSNVQAKLGNEVRNNRVLNVQGAYADKGQFISPAGGVGIYLDNWESGDAIQGNIVSVTSDSCLFFHGNSDLSVTNNLFVDGGPSEVMLAGIAGSSMSNNVMFSNLIGPTSAGAPAGHSLWRVSLNAGVSYPSALASGGNVFTALDPEAVRAGEGPAPVVFFNDVTGNSSSHSFNAWQALAMDTNSTLGGPLADLETDGAGHVIGFLAGSLSAAGLGPLPGLVTGLRHHAETRIESPARKACVVGLLSPAMYAIPSTAMPDPEAVFQCLRQP